MIPAVLFIIFNKPETTQKVFEAIRLAKPSRLYVAADGARENKTGEKELCEQTRKIVQNIDWQCDVKTLFQKENLGCGVGVSTAISWFFENEEMGIILEDDCLPHPSFFHFCGELLEHYKNDMRIHNISGDNFQDNRKRGKASYYFSYMTSIWGWATWRRVWKDFRYNVKDLNEREVLSFIDKTKWTSNMRFYWKNIWKYIKSVPRDAWDYQFLFSQWANNRFTILPNMNLVSNIGFGEFAYHTKDINNPIGNRKVFEIDFPLKHPEIIEVDNKADRYFMNKYMKLGFCEKIKGEKL
ncbi:hypothetical protein R83H12_01669 [Fibrobacteria bacterium R8-3-H12]